MADSREEGLLLKAQRYSLARYSLSILDTAYSFGFLLVFSGFGLSRNLADLLRQINPGKFFLVPSYILVASIFYYLLSFPLTIYRTFILEHKFSLSNQKITDWFSDQLKSAVVSYIVASLLIWAFYFILIHFEKSWLLVYSLLLIFFNLLFAKLTPIVIIPLFFKYKKLSDKNLRQRILNLAGKIKVKILVCFEIDFSRKTLKANAAFVGVGSSRRVILADTLKSKYTHDEVEVILAHECAHYKLKHLLKLIAVNSSVTVICFYLVFKSSAFALRLFGS